MDADKIFKICDPLYNYIYLEKDEFSLLDQPILQRLRFIRQLGFSDEAFPSATHTRFAHSLGAFHLAGEAFDSIFGKNKGLLSEEKKKVFRKILRVASLLHDLGHGPFSHSSETLMPSLASLNLSKYLKNETRQVRHEDYSLKLILEEEGLAPVLKKMGLEASLVAQVLHPEFIGQKHGTKDFFKHKGLNFLPLLRQILSSPFDVDRMDYLHRDSLFCGVRYGLIDFVWLIAQMNCSIQNKQNEDQVFLSIDSSALYTLESLILGRQHMRLVVYFHYKSAIYNEMLKKYSKTCDWVLPSDLSSYLEYTDSRILEQLKKDKSNPWARRIVEKKPYFRLYEAPDYTIDLKTAQKESDKNVKKSQEQREADLKTAQKESDKNISCHPSDLKTAQKESDKNISCRPSDLKTIQEESDKNLFSELQSRLKQEGIDFIVVDSHKNSIKPSKKSQQNSMPVFLENKSLKHVQQWDKNPNLISIPSRTLKRVYVPPEKYPLAEKQLKKLLKEGLS